MKTAMDDLIAKLESATEGSRDLDALISVAVPGADFSFDYTASIDAALTLLPEGMKWGIESHGTGAWES